MIDLRHPLLPFAIQSELMPGRYVKRFDDGTVEPASSTDYLLMVILQKLESLDAAIARIDAKDEDLVANPKSVAPDAGESEIPRPANKKRRTDNGND